MGNVANEKKNSKAIIIVLAISIIISLIIVAASVVYIVKNNSNNNGSDYDYSYSANNDLYQTTGEGIDQLLGEDVETEQFSEQAPAYGDSGNDNKTTTKNSAVEYYEKLSKNGDNKLSDHYDNVYIKLVSAEYGVDTDLLVAIYSVPDTGNNFVLEFDGTKDSEGNIVKSPDTLKKVYQIDLERNIKVATSSGVGNVDVSYAEGLLCFNMVKSLVMEQYPDYFTGIE